MHLKTIMALACLSWQGCAGNVMPGQASPSEGDGDAEAVVPDGSLGPDGESDGGEGGDGDNGGGTEIVGPDGVTAISMPFPREDTSTYTPNKYVNDATGKDSNDGSQNSPWKTLTKAGQAAKAGDIVLVAAGTYTSPLVVDNDGTASEPIVFLGDGNHGDVEIDLSSETEAIDASDRKWVLIENFYVTWGNNWDSAALDVRDADHCTFRKITALTTRSAQSAFTDLSQSNRAMLAAGTHYCWFDQIHIKGMHICAGFGKGAGGHNYISHMHLEDCGRHNLTWNSSGVSGGQYVDENYSYNTLFYRCWFDYNWKADNVQHVGDQTVGQGSYHFSRIIYKQCVFFGAAENALDLKDSRNIYIDECMFYGGVGSDGRGEPFDRYAPTVTVGSGSYAIELTIRKSIFWDNCPGPRTFWKGYVAAHNTLIHLNRDLNGAGQTQMASGGVVGFQGFGHNKAGTDQLMVNNVVWDQLGVHASWADGAKASRINGNAYGQNPGGDGVSWGKVDSSQNSWDEETSFGDWRSWLASCDAEEADADGFVLVGDPFKNVADYPDYESDGDHTSGWDFRPTATSELVGAATAVTYTTNSGGPGDTLVKVDNAYPFTDGFEIMVPDFIRIDGKQRVKITNVSYSAKEITIENPGVSWGSGDRIDFDYDDAYGPTIGALEPDDTVWWEQVN